MSLRTNAPIFTKDEFFEQLLKDMAAWIGVLARSARQQMDKLGVSSDPRIDQR